MSKWIETINETPPENEVVNVMDSGGNVQELKFKNRLWWFPDESMYVYFVPVRWEAINE